MSIGETIEQVFIAVGLKTDGIQKGMTQAEGMMRAGFKNILANVVAPAMAAFAGGDFIRQMSEEAEEVQRNARLVGMATEEFSAWAAVANRAGIETEEFGDILTDINDKATDLIANDAGAFKELIERGLVTSFVDADGAMKSTQEIVYEISDALKSLGGQEGAGLAKRLGFNDPRMIEFLMQGRSQMRHLTEEMRRNGVYTDADADAAKELKNELADIGRNLRMALLPAFRMVSPLIKTFASGVKFASEHVGALVPAIALLSAIMAGKLILAIKETGMALWHTFGVRGLAVVAILTTLGLLFDDFLTWLNDGDSALGDFWAELFGPPEEARAMFADLWERVKSGLPTLLKFAEVIGIFGGIAIAVNGVISLFSALSALIPIVTAAAQAMGISMSVALGPVGLAIMAVIAALALLVANWDTVRRYGIAALDAIAGKAQEFSAWWNGFTNGLGEAWQSFINFVKGLWDTFAGGVINKALEIKDAVSGWGDKVGEFVARPFSFSEGGGAVDNSTHEATQTNTYNIYGDVGKKTLEAANGAAGGFQSLVTDSNF